MPSPPAPSSTTRPARPSSHRKSSSGISVKHPNAPLERIDIHINVYDLLPPGSLSNLLWAIGGGLLHSGVAINGREYAYGGHNKRATTGVYFTRPGFEPPGGTHRISILQGFTFKSQSEIDVIIREVSETFLGPAYNLLSRNCNHFTSALCERLTSKPAPSWLNRAAGLGMAFPCMVPRDWISPPDVETAEGELLDDDNEHAAMMQCDRRRRRDEADDGGGRGRRASPADEVEEDADDMADGVSLAGGRRLRGTRSPPPRLVKVKDSDGQTLPVAERAPLPRRKS